MRSFIHCLIGIQILLAPVTFAYPLKPDSCSHLLSSQLKAPFVASTQIQTSQGPRLHFTSRGKKPALSQLKELKIANYNVLNLLEYHGPNSTQVVAKPTAQLIEIANTIQRAQPDLLVLEEVDSLAALTVLSSKYLGGKYFPILIEGNDPRGIDIGFLIRTDLALDIEVQSHREVYHVSAGQTEKLYSRDLPVYFFRPAGAPQGSKPLFILIGTHFKSQRDSENDPRSVGKRTEQAKAVAQTIDQYRDYYQNQVPVILAGDFNADVRTGLEFSPLRKIGMIDSMDLGQDPISATQRTTHTYHPKSDPGTPPSAPVFAQLDMIMVSPEAQQNGLVKNATIIRYLDQHGKERPIPTTYQQRQLQPSDHFMVMTTFDFQKLIDTR